jgi:multisubunit Na+/H+ antiporter MnhE subunit
VKRAAFGAGLVVVWLLLWDSPTWGLLVAGAAVVTLMLLVLRQAAPVDDDRLVVRPVAVARLSVWFAWQFVLSNLLVARAALFPRAWVRAGVVRVELHTDSPTLVALVSNVTALTPGMQPVDTEPVEAATGPSAISIHVLFLTSADDTKAVIWRLEELVRHAFDPEWLPVASGSRAGEAGP